MKFEWRKLFPISWYRFNKGYSFNAFAFYVDLIIVFLIPLSIILVLSFLKLID